MGNSSPPLHIQSTDITNTQPGEAELKLYDLSGRLITTQNFIVSEGGNSLSLDLKSTGIESGVYIIHIKAPGLSEGRRIVFAP